jgi:RimJ/RimL family protein N-acetyltransferase
VEPVEITAGSLHLRAPQPVDVPDLVRACSDPEIARWTRVPSPYGENDAHAYVESSRVGWSEDTSARFAVLDPTTARLLASIALFRTRGVGDGDAAVGYWVAPWARGRGVGRRALGTVCRWGFAALDLPRISWIAAVGNTGSRALAERVGFTVEGTLRSGIVLRDRRRDCWVGSLVPGDPIT